MIPKILQNLRQLPQELDVPCKNNILLSDRLKAEPFSTENEKDLYVHAKRLVNFFELFNETTEKQFEKAKETSTIFCSTQSSQPLLKTFQMLEKKLYFKCSTCRHQIVVDFFSADLQNPSFECKNFDKNKNYAACFLQDKLISNNYYRDQLFEHVHLTDLPSLKNKCCKFNFCVALLKKKRQSFDTISKLLATISLHEFELKLFIKNFEKK